MKKEEKSFQQLVNEVIQQAKNEASRNTQHSSSSYSKIDKSANIADEWGMTLRNDQNPSLRK